MAGSIPLGFRLLHLIQPSSLHGTTELRLEPIDCPELDFSSAADSIKHIWQSRSEQTVIRTPLELLAELDCSDTVECHAFVLPVSSHELALLPNWVRFASSLRPPLDYIILPLDDASRNAVIAPPASREGVASQQNGPASTPGRLAAIAPLVYLPFEDGLLGHIAAAITQTGGLDEGGLSAADRSYALAEGYAPSELAGMRRQYLSRLPLAVAATLQWRVIADLLMKSSGLTVAVGKASTLLLTNPLPLLLTLPEVRWEA